MSTDQPNVAFIYTRAQFFIFVLKIWNHDSFIFAKIITWKLADNISSVFGDGCRSYFNVDHTSKTPHFLDRTVSSFMSVTHGLTVSPCAMFYLRIGSTFQFFNFQAQNNES